MDRHHCGVPTGRALNSLEQLLSQKCIPSHGALSIGGNEEISCYSALDRTYNSAIHTFAVRDLSLISPGEDAAGQIRAFS